MGGQIYAFVYANAVVMHDDDLHDDDDVHDDDFIVRFVSVFVRGQMEALSLRFLLIAHALASTHNRSI